MQRNAENSCENGICERDFKILWAMIRIVEVSLLVHRYLRRRRRRRRRRRCHLWFEHPFWEWP